MNSDRYKQRLEKIIGLVRAYGYRLFEGLTSEELLWRPEGTRARTIQSYLRHIVNAEIFWLKNLGDETIDYLEKNASFNEIMDVYKQLEGHLVQSVAKATKDDIIPRKPVYEEKQLQQKGNLGWMIERTSLHSIHHFAQVAHIRYSIEKPPSTEPVTWGEVIDSFIFL